MTKDSQNAMIYKYLQTHKRGLTGLDALKKFRCFRLPARISDIEKKHRIEIPRMWVEVEDADGNRKRVNRYYING